MFGAAGLIAYSLLRKASAAGTLNFYPGGVYALKWEDGKPVIYFNITIQNTSNQGFQMNSMAGNVYANNILVGNGSFFGEVNILPNSQGTLKLRIEMLLLGILNDIIDAIENGNFKQVLELEAYANVDNIQIPVNLTYTVGV